MTIKGLVPGEGPALGRKRLTELDDGEHACIRGLGILRSP